MGLTLKSGVADAVWAVLAEADLSGLLRHRPMENGVGDGCRSSCKGLCGMTPSCSQSLDTSDASTAQTLSPRYPRRQKQIGIILEGELIPAVFDDLSVRVAFVTVSGMLESRSLIACQ